jgi:hypothetical protein
MWVQRRLAGMTFVGAVVLFATTAAFAHPSDNYQIKLNARDQAAARAAALHRADLATLQDLAIASILESNVKWEGGMAKPHLSADPSLPPACRTKESDLVLTGAAESHFMTNRIGLAMVALNSQVNVLQTGRMALLDWQRFIKQPQSTTCAHQVFLGVVQEKWFGDRQAKGRLKSFKRMNYPRNIRDPAAFIATAEVQALGRNIPMALELLIQTKGRTQITLYGVAISGSAVMAEAELMLFIHQLTPIVVGRARA